MTISWNRVIQLFGHFNPVIHHQLIGKTKKADYTNMSTPLTKNIGIIGHDLIGALNGIGIYKTDGLIPTVQLDGQIPENLDVVAVTTMNKIATPRIAYRQMRKAIVQCHGRYLSFYEAHSLMGNISADIKAIIDELKPEKLILCTAWPELNNYTRGAYSYIGNMPVNKSIRASDAITPIRESYLPKIVYEYSGLTSKVINLTEVERGADYITGLINNSPEKVIICDATRPHHLKSIAEAVIRNRDSWISCGSRGLIREMPPLLGYQKQEHIMNPLQNKEPVLLVLGSISDVTAVQLATSAEKGILYPVLIEPADLWHKKERLPKMHQLAREAGQQISRGNNVAISSASSRFIPQLRKTAAYLLSQIARIVIEEYGIKVLFINGADTAYAFCRTMEIEKLEVRGSITSRFCPILLDGYSSSGKYYSLCLNHGSYGDGNTIVQALRFLRQD
jgi:uncharacterized protein YgbK (DUF1537 family)